jgi:hypothetical protein
LPLLATLITDAAGSWMQLAACSHLQRDFVRCLVSRLLLLRCVVVVRNARVLNF